jgi:protocatechuate 3,4-dioxygenase beta subunit
MSSTFRHVRFLLPAVAGLAAAACGGSDVVLPSEGVAANIVIVSGNSQAGVVGATLVDSLIVRVTDSKNRPVQNQQVTFAPGNAGSGQAVPPTATTNADGRAGVKWVLGAVAGAQTMVAKPTGNGAPANLSVSFAATASSAVPSKLVKSAGDGQTSSAGGAVPVPPAVTVTDADGNPVAGVAVTFAVASGGGSVNPTTAVATNASGVAAVTSWTLGAVAGPNSLTATAAGAGISGNPATFTATGKVGAAAKLGLAVAPSASAGSGVPLPVQPQIQIQDAAGNPVASANVSISVNISSGGGTLSGGPTVVQTNASGLATFSGLTINGPTGPYTLLFTASGLASVSAPVTVGAGNPSGSQSSFSISPSSFVAGSAGSTVTVTARDASGNPIAGAAAAVNVTGTNSVSTLAPTDANGQTTATITSTEAGVKTVTVTINGITVTNPPSATLTVLPGAPSLTVSTVSAAPTTLVAGNGTSATVTVTVKDAFGNPISGASVTLASAGGTITQPAATTNASGATTGSVSYATAGAKTVSATVNGTLSLSQTASITVNPAPTTVTFNPPGAATAGVAFSVTATVAPNSPSGGTPTGTITVGDGTDQCAISLPATSCLLTLNATGSVLVTASYGGDANYQASSKSASISVSGSATNTSVGSSDANSVFGEAVIFTANVTSGAGTPTGSVVFKDGGTCSSGGTLLDTETLVSGSATSVGISTLSVSGSPHTILACYQGGGSFASSNGSVTQTVNQAATTTGVGSSANPSVFGQSVTFTATVSVSAPGGGTPTGTVQFQADGSNIGGAVALSGGVATRSTSGLAVGAHVITATYNGSTNFQGSVGTLSGGQTVNQGATTTTITSDLSVATTSADPITVSYDVNPVAPASGAVNGGGASVTVSLDAGGGGESCTGSVAADGTGSCTIAAPIGAGTPRTVTAVYSGNTNFSGSTSAPVSHDVNP